MRIRRFNESVEESFEEYFIDFIDYGFSYKQEENKFILKLNIRNKDIDFNEIYGMYDMVINRLLMHKGIAKTVFDFKETVINVMVEIKDNFTEDKTIEVLYKGNILKLKPSNVIINSTHNALYSINLNCNDINNKEYDIQWFVKDHKYEDLTKTNSSVKIGGQFIKIDIENATKIFNIIKNREVRFRFQTESIFPIFLSKITPEILSRN